jgi:hypothetical protein
MSEDSLDMWLRDTPLATDAAIFCSTICFAASTAWLLEMGVFL